MTVSVDYTESTALTALCAFLSYLEPAASVVYGQQNNVSLPLPPAIVVTPISAPELNVPLRTYDRANGSSVHTQSKEWRVQIDVYSDNAADVADALAIAFRSTVASDYFEQYAIDNSVPFQLQTLYASAPRNMVFINESSNYENRWMVEVFMHLTQSIAVPQQFAESLSAQLVELDTHFAP